MKISLEWLSAFIDWNETDPHVVAERLTLSTAEVEGVDVQGAFLDHCCVGEIVSAAKHPDADRLSVCEVKTDKGIKKVVCGGTNVKEGMQVAFAHVGATVKWHGGETMTLAPVKIRGVSSEGMICAAEELGLESLFPPKPEDGERPIVDLAEHGCTTGDALREALNMNDAVLDINNTAITTRPDLFSHLGFARECVALGLGTWKKKQPGFKLPSSSSKKKAIAMTVECPDLVQRYLSCLMAIDGLGETPAWMKRRLEAVGVRSVNLPVDITNYVMQEIGVPLHSFDADDMQGDVHLRLTGKNEKIRTLDDVDRPLPESVMVLSDDAGIFDLLGIMGGLRSSTKAGTRRVYLHALSLDPATIRKAIIGTGHRTDAATVYEKNVPPVTAEQGFARAVELFLELVPGAAVASAIGNEGSNGKAKAIGVDTDVINAVLGTAFTGKEITGTFESLECHVAKTGKKGQFKVTPPLHRLRDITGVHDLTEEVGRIRGFDAVPVTMPVAPLQLPDRDERIHNLRDGLKNAGFWETVPLSFMSPALLQKCGLPLQEAIAIRNPLGEETSLLQSHTLPHLLAQAQEQLPKAEGALRIFQWGHVFGKKHPEHAELSALIAAKGETSLLEEPFLIVKQSIVDAARGAGYDLRVTEAPEPPAYAHPGRCAVLTTREHAVGLVYEIHPAVRARFGLPGRAAAATLNLHELLAHPAAIVQEEPIPHFPAVTYDVTCTRTHADALGGLLQQLRSAETLLEDVSVQDLYAGKPLENGTYNLTLRFVYRSPERTLTENEAKAAHEKVLASAGLQAR